jgi:hypothetical protein
LPGEEATSDANKHERWWKPQNASEPGRSRGLRSGASGYPEELVDNGVDGGKGRMVVAKSVLSAIMDKSKRFGVDKELQAREHNNFERNA